MDWGRLRSRLSLGLAVSISLASFAVLPLHSLAERFQPTNVGRPGRRVGGGTRGGCAFGNPSRLTALLPESNLGLTTQPYPTFYWFIPQNTAQFVEFSLYRAEAAATTEQQQLVYRSTFAVSGAAGVASLKLPESAGLAPLELGQDYQWSVALVCNADARQQDLRVDGWVQRLEPTDDLAAQLATEPASSQVALYAANGFWFDALDQLIALRQTYPAATTVQTRWSEFLASVKLDEIAEQPILPEDLPPE